MKFAGLAIVLLFRSLTLGQTAKDPTLKGIQRSTSTSHKAMPKSGVPASAVQAKGSSTAKELARIEQETVKAQTRARPQHAAAATAQANPQGQGKNKRINATYRPPRRGQQKGGR
jgi:hypothetical protein